MGRRSGHLDLVVFHEDAAAARRTIERLSRAGIDGGAIELLPGSEVVTAGRYGDRQTDRGSSLALGRRVLRGMGWGGCIGAVLGAALLAVVGERSWPPVAAGALGGLVFGLSVGVLTLLLSAPTMASSWERTFAPMIPGGVFVGVRIQRPRDDRRARRALRDVEVTRIDEVADIDELPAP